jgi:hypothetical protein
VADWLNTIVTNRGFDLVVGAILASITGYVATRIQEVRNRKSVREGLGAILHAELIAETPNNDPIYWDPDQAMRLKIRSIPQLLAPGILDPTRDQQIMMDLLSLDTVVSEFNERAMLWDQAFAAGADEKKLQSLYSSLQSSNLDYRRSHAGVMKQLWQLGPPIDLSHDYKEPSWRESLREKFELWRTRKLRNAWIDHDKREKRERQELATIFGPPPTGEQGNAASPDTASDRHPAS